MRLTLATFVALCLFAPRPGAAQPQVPAPSGPINDFANVLDDATEARLRQTVEATGRDTTAEIAIATVPSLEGSSIEEMATRYFNTWGVGQRAVNNGVLVLVAPNEREVRIEVGYGLEPILPDGLAGDIVQRTILPRFKDGDYPGGIVAAVDRLATIIRNKHVVTPEEREELARAAEAEGRPPKWLTIPFFGVFLTIGGYLAGSSLKSKEGLLLVFGLLFSALPGLMSFIPFFNASPYILMPWFGVMAVQGYRQTARGKSWRWQTSSSVGSLGGTLSTRSSRSSSGRSSGSSSSSSSSFGGGSSGGGGASGRW